MLFWTSFTYFSLFNSNYYFWRNVVCKRGVFHDVDFKETEKTKIERGFGLKSTLKSTRHVSGSTSGRFQTRSQSLKSTSCHDMSSVCLSSVTRVYGDKKTEVMIMWFSHRGSAKS